MPDTSTEVALATTTLSSAASSITFSSIPSTYTDLRLVVVTRPSANFPGLRCRINSDSSTLYSYTQLTGTGSIAESVRSSGNDFFHLSSQSTNAQFLLSITNFFNYAGSTNKTMLQEVSYDRNGSGTVQRTVHLYRSTNSISSLYLYTSSDSFDTGTTATLYGIL